MVMRRLTVSSTVRTLAVYNKARTSLLIQVISGGALNISENESEATAGGMQLAIGDIYSRIKELGGQPELAIFGVRATADVEVGIVEDFGQADVLAGIRA